jgi:hypothetical protein
MKGQQIHIACCFFLVVVCLVACKPPAATISSRNKETKQKDSVRIEYKDRPIEILVPGEKVMVKEYIECDENTHKPKPKPKTIQGKGDKAFVKTTIDETGAITTTGGCDSLTAKLNARDKEVTHWKQLFEKESSDKQESRAVIEYKTRWYDYVARFLAFLLLLLYAPKIIKTLLKFYKPI